MNTCIVNPYSIVYGGVVYDGRRYRLAKNGETPLIFDEFGNGMVLDLKKDYNVTNSNQLILGRKKLRAKHNDKHTKIDALIENLDGIDYVIVKETTIYESIEVFRQKIDDIKDKNVFLKRFREGLQIQ